MFWYYFLGAVLVVGCAVACTHGELVSDKIKSASFVAALGGVVYLIIGCTVTDQYDQFWYTVGGISFIIGLLLSGLGVFWNAKFELGQRSRSYSKIV